MPRIVFNRWKCSLYIITFFFLGFFLGSNYWQIILPDHCSSIISTFSQQSLISIQSTLFYNHFQYRTIRTCRNETSKIFLTIAIISSHERLVEYLPAILETWILTTTNEIEIIIFLEEKSFHTEEFLEQIFSNLNSNIQSCIFIVKLKHVENEYPPQKKSFYAMKFLYTFYTQRTSWILRLDDNAYVNIPKLIQWLKSIDHQQPLYIGQGGTGRHNGPAIHFPPEKYFCMGGSGVILSQQTLSILGLSIDQCLQFELLTNHEDVELGRCILTHVNIGCTNAYNSKTLFYHHYGPSYLFGYDFTPKILSQALIVHPINNRNLFRQIFSFYYRQVQVRNHNLTNWKSTNYVTFLNSIEFDLIRDIHYQLIDVRWKKYIDTNILSYIEHLQKVWYQRSSNWTIVNGKFLFGYHRVIPTSGLELIVELLISLRSKLIPPSRSMIVRKRFHLRQSFVNKNHLNYREIINLDLNQENDQLNLIVVSSNKDKALKRFIQNYHYEIFNYPDRQKQFTLTILYFFHKNSILDSIDQFRVRYSLMIRLIIINETEHRYNRGYGRQLASKYFTSNQLLFFLDVDVIFTGQSLINTRRLLMHQLSISSCAVYFPIIYSRFSNRFNRSMIAIQKHSGIFSIYGFGNVAVRKKDLERVGSWEIDNHDWGVEDVNLFARFVNFSSECSIFRAVEPGLKHNYHKKMCHGIKNKIREKMCYDAETNLFASQIDMTNYIFDKHIFI